MYLAIAHAIEADVLAGRLQPGDRLPTHRELAGLLKVTVGTVSRAYSEARKAGWTSGEVGRGTFVLDRRSGGFPSLKEEPPALIDLSLNVPLEGHGPDLASALRALSTEGGVQSLLRYTQSDRTRNDRVAGALVLKQHGLTVEPENVILCAGAQHGIGAALETVARPGDCVLAEELTYPAFRSIAEGRGLRVYPVRLDRYGIIPDALEAACRKVRPKALYIIPTLHNPTTVSLSEVRRRAVINIVRRHAITILEDDIHRMLAPEAPAPLAALAPDQTIYVASLSKTFAAGLRVGYLAAPASLRDRLADAVWRSMWTLSPITTALATRWIRSGEFTVVTAAKRREAEARQQLAAKILPRAQVRAASAAYHLWLNTAPFTADAFTLKARVRGVAVTPSSAFHVGSGPAPPAVRVSLSAAADRSVLAAGLNQLREVLRGVGTSGSANL